ncbi:MAG: hypothetical protein HGA85_08155 [Nanoarchaeota archaeon]|nr:hypothetical protein [Nanoarchaeota archaeon]
MNPIVKKDILNVLNEAIACLEKKELFRLREISDHVIHNASVFQDKESITIAVTIYALSKLYPVEEEIAELSMPLLKDCRNSLLQGDMNAYETNMKGIITHLKKYEKTKAVIQEVLERAQVKKASRMYEHGVSMGVVADALDISLWELMDYVGKTRINDEFEFKEDVEDRIKYARRLFSR